MITPLYLSQILFIMILNMIYQGWVLNPVRGILRNDDSTLDLSYRKTSMNDESFETILTPALGEVYLKQNQDFENYLN